MNLEFLLLLACPLMMLICMKGMFTGEKDKRPKSSNHQKQEAFPKIQPGEIQSIQIKMEKLMEQNHELMNEVKELKKAQGNNQTRKEGQSFK